MKQLIILMSLALSLNSYAQEDKIVTLVASGQGKNQDEAKNNALRSAIEQAFGIFISSKTELLNDNLVKDEIVSISNGNIQKFEIVSEIQMPQGGYVTSLKATVSVTKLTAFAQSKGVTVEFKGSLFAFNVNQQILNEKNEAKAIEDLCKVISKLSDASFEYSIKASDPVAINASNDKWRIPMYISVSANSNLFNIATYINQTLKGISLSIDEANNYEKLGKKVYPISFAANEKEYNYILLRTEKSLSNLIYQLYYFNHSLQKFKISNGISEFTIKDKYENLKYIYDYGFRIFIKKINNGSDYNAYCKASVFYLHCSPRGSCNVGMVKELNEVYSDNCGFSPGDNPILNYKNWSVPSTELQKIYLRNTNINTFQTEFDPTSSDLMERFKADHYFEKQFAFVKKLKNVINNQTGLIISFIGINLQNEIIRFYYEDIRSLEEINKISEYKVLSTVN